ncbi:hypothetical protein [Roseovarius sp.]|uniref:hypothetical protein n=1 Tax=Roseovarius sp. TaxID=1486281 RepID=UPI0026222ED9|nr:hypothetical protein [Roseovarius sp.]MDM8165173.1 hypothetical protein [Roseovarius sp.]
MAGSDYRLRDKLRLLLGIAFGLFVGWMFGLLSFLLISVTTDLGTIAILITVLFVISIPSGVFYLMFLPLDWFFEGRRNAAFERMSEDEKVYDTHVTRLVQKTFWWSSLAGIVAGMITAAMQSQA